MGEGARCVGTGALRVDVRQSRPASHGESRLLRAESGPLAWRQPRGRPARVAARATFVAGGTWQRVLVARAALSESPSESDTLCAASTGADCSGLPFSGGPRQSGPEPAQPAARTRPEPRPPERTGCVMLCARARMRRCARESVAVRARSRAPAGVHPRTPACPSQCARALARACVFVHRCE
jgi:hypothetical protein